MKILMVENFLPGNRYTLELCKELTKIVQVDVACRIDAGENDGSVRLLKLLDYRKPNKQAFLWHWSMSMLLLVKTIVLGKYDIIHVQGTMLPQLEFPLYTFLKGKRRKLVYTVHNILPHEAKESDKERCQNFYRQCDRLVVHNNWTREQLVDEYGIRSDRIVVMPHGTYQTKQVPSADQTSAKRFLSFGMIRKYKGIDILLYAIAALPKQEREKMHFVIAGAQNKKLDDTPYREMIEQLGISGCTEFLDRRIADAELPGLFASADACLFPYREIYGSGALLMAYSYEKPVIASDVPAFVEETNKGETGLLFQNENAGSLAKALVAFAKLSEQEVAKKKAAIHRMVEEKYNWRHSAGLLKKMYQDLSEEKV